MTNDTKADILNYLAGNVNPETPTDEIIFENQQTIATDYFTKLNEFIAQEGYDYVGIEGEAVYKKDMPGAIIYYWGLKVADDVTSGFMVLLNDNYEIINIINKYDSGTQFREFMDLHFDENDNLYGIDNDAANGSRIILLNNPLTSPNNVVKLRNSYYFQNGYSPQLNIQGIKLIDKIENEGTYVINAIENTNSYVGLLIFKIVVGGTNEWNFYSLGSRYAKLYDYLPSLSNDNVIVYLVALSVAPSTDILYFDGSNYSMTYRDSEFSIHNNNNVLMINSTTYYRSWNDGTNVSIVKVNGNTKTTITNSLKTGINYELYKNNGYIMTFRKDNSQQNCYGGVIYNDILYEDSYPSTEVFSFAILKNSYLLYQNAMLADDGSIHVISYLLNNNYNGIPYDDYNSTVSKYGKLYNSNSEIIFARNLYNKTIYNNQNISTLQVPASDLNNTIIGNEQLISETNKIMVNNNENLEKNQYESLFLNFINTINVIDEDTETSYQNTANYVNNNINIGTSTNYNNTKLAKVRINTSTPTIQNISWTKVDDLHYYTSFGINVGEAIPSIDFISNDETTIYITIDTSTMVVGNTYNITQYLRIE